MDDYGEKLIKRYESKYELPKKMYHYTTQNGLLGIFNSLNIWATDILYLNDEAEFIYAAEKIENKIRNTLKSSNKDKSKEERKRVKQFTKFLEGMLDRSKILDDYQIFVCSFSANGNLLSQWRAYCPNNNGFSVGFDYLQLRNIAKTQESITFYLLPCFYEKNEQDDIIEELRKDTLQNIISCLQKDMLDDLNKISEDYTRRYLLISSILKDRSFSEEKEWRLFCLKKTSHIISKNQFRKGASMIIPYLNIELQSSSDETPIKEIIIGPTPHKELSKKSVELLIRSKKVKCIVKDSEIPYRTW